MNIPDAESASDDGEYKSSDSSSSSSSSYSDSSDSSSEERSRRRRRHKKKGRKHRRRKRGRRSHRSQSPGDTPQGPPNSAPGTASQEADTRYAGEAKVVMCSEHKNDLVPLSCRACKAMTHMLRFNVRPDLVVDGSIPSTSAIPHGKERLARKRSDATEPTLMFSPEEMELRRQSLAR